MTALFISDLHIAPARPAVTAALLRFLCAVPASGDALYVLGDLFDFWVGDDDIDTPLHREVVKAFAGAATRGVALYWIPGNRDFLTGDAFAEAARFNPLPEPYTFDLHGMRTVLLHGDTLCSDDGPYQAFRAEVRASRWRDDFLARPLLERRTEIETLRARSEREKRAKPALLMDVNRDTVAQLFGETGATRMIHGHTHRPARHDYLMFGRQTKRWVLPAWEDQPGYLRVDERGGALINLDPIQAENLK